MWSSRRSSSSATLVTFYSQHHLVLRKTISNKIPVLFPLTACVTQKERRADRLIYIFKLNLPHLIHSQISFVIIGRSEAHLWTCPRVVTSNQWINDSVSFSQSIGECGNLLLMRDIKIALHLPLSILPHCNWWEKIRGFNQGAGCRNLMNIFVRCSVDDKIRDETIKSQ